MPKRIWAWESWIGQRWQMRKPPESVVTEEYFSRTEHERLLAEAVERALSHQPNAETLAAITSTNAGDVIECKGFTDLMDKLEEEETDAKT